MTDVAKEGENVVLYESTPNLRGEILRATVNSYKGKLYARIGTWWQGKSGDWKPGKGISRPFDSEGVESLSEAVAALAKYLEQ